MTGDGPRLESFLCADEGQGPDQCAERETLNLELHALRSELESTVSPGGLIGVSSRIYRKLRQYSHNSF
jgi:hypothetical protein